MSASTSDLTLRDALAATGRVTGQRLCCLRALQDADHHLTGHELVDAVRAQLPHVRPSTVYRTMALFLESGLAHRVDGFRGSRYGVGHGHAHAVCPRCDRIEDLDLGQVMPLIERVSGPALGVTVVALCSNCRRTPWGRPGVEPSLVNARSRNPAFEWTSRRRASGTAPTTRPSQGRTG